MRRNASESSFLCSSRARASFQAAGRSRLPMTSVLIFFRSSIPFYPCNLAGDSALPSIAPGECCTRARAIAMLVIREYRGRVLRVVYNGSAKSVRVVTVLFRPRTEAHAMKVHFDQKTDALY